MAFGYAAALRNNRHPAGVHAGNGGVIALRNEVDLTEWDSTARTDLEALRNAFDTNHDGKLIQIVTDWAQAQRAEELHIHSTSGIDPGRTDKLLHRLGFKTYGGNYAARVG